MSKKADKYGILKKTINILEKMDLGTVTERAKDTSIETALELTYKNATSELISYISKKVHQITDIDNLARCFRDCCYAFGALGLRYDLLKENLTGKQRSEAEILKEAIEYDLVDYTPEWGICCSGNNIRSTLSVDAFEDNTYGDIDKRALVSMVLLDYILSNGYDGLDIATVMRSDMIYGCIRYLLEGAENRSIIGYIESWKYHSDGADRGFIKLFAEKLKSLLTVQESVQVIEMLQYLQEQVIMAWTGSSMTRSIIVYNEIERLIDASRSSTIVDYELYRDLIYIRDFAVTKRYNHNGMLYELNCEGLVAFADLLDALGLRELQEVAHIIDKIRAVCI